MEVKLYSTRCPKCKVIETKLNNKGIDYQLELDIDRINEFAKEEGITSAPILVVDGEALDFTHANTWLNRI